MAPLPHPRPAVPPPAVHRDWAPWALGALAAAAVALLAITHLGPAGPVDLVQTAAQLARSCEAELAEAAVGPDAWARGGRQLYGALCTRATRAVAFERTPLAHSGGWVLLGWRDAAGLWHRAYVGVQREGRRWIALEVTPTPPLPDVPTAAPLPNGRTH